MKATKKIVIIGTGNVAFVLGEVLSAKFKVLEVYGRNSKEVHALAKKLKAKPVTDLKKITPDADIYFCCIKDDLIKTLSNQLKVKGIVVHTSGSIGMKAVSKHKHHGVFYPLQTLNKKETYNWNEIPVFIESDSQETAALLKNIAKQVSKKVFEASSETRRQIHLAAVFANNFTNHLLEISDRIIPKQFAKERVMEPLIRKTIENALKDGAAESQTGPAKRKDKKVIQSHLKMLGNDKKIKDIYKAITESIIQKYHG